MAQHAQIEELSDSSMDSDPPEVDLDNFAPTAAAGFTDPALRASQSGKVQSLQEPPLQPQEILRPTLDRGSSTAAPPPTYRSFACLYPLYFDAGRTRTEGRRVKRSQAVANPLAREIVDAVQGLGLKVVFEPGKCHPKDWSNPGRVRVGLRESGSRAKVHNSEFIIFPLWQRSCLSSEHHLYILVSEHLRQHPTTPEAPLRLRIQGMPMPDGPVPAPAVPKGYKINSIVPLHSPAMSGGGINENMLGDMMKEMQDGGGDNPMASMLSELGALGGGAPAESSAKRKSKKR